MKILFISNYGDAADIALRMSLDGENVRLFIKDLKSKENYDGMVRKVQTWQEGMAWRPDLAVFEDNKCPEIWNAIHRSVPCFGGSAFGAKLEDDRKFGHQIMSQCGLQRFETLDFRTVDQAIAHLRTHKAKHVIKPYGGKTDSWHVMISHFETGEDAIAMLERFKKQNIPYDGIAMEERKQGFECAISGWFNGTDWCYPTANNFEHKQIYANRTSPLCGEAGTIIKYDEDRDNPFFLNTLAKIKPILKAHDYRGQIDLNMIATLDEHGEPTYWPLEFTPRLGKPSIFIESEGHITQWAKLFYDIASGRDPGLQVHYDWLAGVVLFGFGFPFEKEYMKAGYGMPLVGVKNLDHVHLMQAREGRDGELICGAGEGYLLVTTGRGETITDAADRAYAEIEALRVPNAFYRKDIGQRTGGISGEIFPGVMDQYKIFKQKTPVLVE